MKTAVSMPQAVFTSVGIHLGCALLLFLMITPHKPLYVSIPIEFIQPSAPVSSPPAEKHAVSPPKPAAKPVPPAKKVQPATPDKPVEKPVPVPEKTQDAVPVAKAVPVEKKAEPNVQPAPPPSAAAQSVQKPVQSVRVRSRVMPTATVSQPIGSFTPTVHVDNFPYAYYLAQLQSKVSAAWNAPSGIGSRYAQVYFRIGRDGRVISSKIDKTSGNALFDEAALRAVRISEPFPPLPDAYPEQELGVYFGFAWR